MVKRILEVAIRNGAKPAEPGEFTKRAFLNGKMDLSQAEAVSDLIYSKNEYALKSSISQLKGSIKKKIKEIRNELIYQIAYIESALDDPEHISLEGFSDILHESILSVCKELEKLLEKADNGRLIKEGIKTVIIGKPNAGKSSLLNLLAGEDRAIVTDVAGTTRDILEEHISIHGISLHLIDTAGIRDTKDIVEKIGVEKAKTFASDADLLIYVVDASVPLDENDDKIIELIQDKKTIILLNKSDLNVIITKDLLKSYIEKPMVEVSAKEETGINELELLLKEMFFQGSISFNDEIYITNVRQKYALQEALESLLNVLESIKKRMSEDFYSIDLIDAYESLGKITGETIGEDLVNEIFSKFCMGK